MKKHFALLHADGILSVLPEITRAEQAEDMVRSINDAMGSQIRLVLVDVGAMHFLDGPGDASGDAPARESRPRSMRLN